MSTIITIRTFGLTLSRFLSRLNCSSSRSKEVFSLDLIDFFSSGLYSRAILTFNFDFSFDFDFFFDFFDFLDFFDFISSSSELEETSSSSSEDSSSSEVSSSDDSSSLDSSSLNIQIKTEKYSKNNSTLSFPSF